MNTHVLLFIVIPLFLSSSDGIAGQTRRIFYGCGSYGLDPLIMDDSLFKYQPFPWMVAFYHSFELVCGGTIVSNKIVVLAAHCIQEKGEFTPKHNEQNTYFVAKKQNGSNKILDVQKYVIHPDWNIKSRNYEADIALAILRNPIKFTDQISPACLPAQSHEPKNLHVGMEGTIGGWDFSDKYLLGEGPKIVRQTIESQENCVKNEKFLKILMSSRTFCTGWRSGPGLCKGDSGSGLVIKENQRFVLRGIVSAAVKRSCTGNKSTVFTDVAKFSNWIQHFVRNS